MNFSDTAKAPVVVFVGTEKVNIPKFVRADWKVWAAESDAKRLTEATKDLSPEDRFKFVAFYSVPPTSADELRNAAVVTPEGQDYVVRKCLTKAGWDEERIADFLDANDPQDVQLLAIQLASIRPRIPMPLPSSNTPSVPEGEQSSDPQETAPTDLASD